MHIPVRLCSWTHWIMVELTTSLAVCIKSFNRIPQSKTMHIMPRGHIETDPSTSSYFVTLSLEYIFLYSWCTIKTTIWQSSLFLSEVWCLLWLLQPLSPLDPRRPLHMLYMFIATCHCPKGILGLGGLHLKTNWKTPVSPFHWQTSQF